MRPTKEFAESILREIGPASVIYGDNSIEFRTTLAGPVFGRQWLFLRIDDCGRAPTARWGFVDPDYDQVAYVYHVHSGKLEDADSTMKVLDAFRDKMKHVNNLDFLPSFSGMKYGIFLLCQADASAFDRILGRMLHLHVEDWALVREIARLKGHLERAEKLYHSVCAARELAA